MQRKITLLCKSGQRLNSPSLAPPLPLPPPHAVHCWCSIHWGRLMGCSFIPDTQGLAGQERHDIGPWEMSPDLKTVMLLSCQISEEPALSNSHLTGQKLCSICTLPSLSPGTIHAFQMTRTDGPNH